MSRPRAKGLVAETPAVYRNRRGERIAPSSYTASEAKREFGRVLETVIRGGIVIITRHQAPKAVLLQIDDFNALASTAERTLDTLSGEFDALLSRMQAPKVRAGMRAAFDASPKRIGRAVAAARRRG